MNKVTLFSIILALFLTGNVFAQIEVKTDGKVVVGTSPVASGTSSNLEVIGNCGTNNAYNFKVTYAPNNGGLANTVLGGLYSIGNSTWTALYAKAGGAQNAAYFLGQVQVDGAVVHSSDENLKTNFRSILSPLDKIKSLQGYKYDWKPRNIYPGMDEKARLYNEKLNKDNLGFKAQDVSKVIPEVVYFDEGSQTFGINYTGLIPVLVEAIKEQQAIIDDLKTKMQTCCSKNNLKSDSKLGIEQTNSDNYPEAALYQNEPNPFDQNTLIRFEIPAIVINAGLYIYDMQGTQKKSITISARGNASITINGSELEAGMYMYSLITDGKEVDTKRMILTK